ncbi:MAG: sulfatase-like hydrolase/transferase [Armatimonadetes bacterium]|nr:sulfatase-like hydrolase/transferase [Armatimonadota bacterium]
MRVTSLALVVAGLAAVLGGCGGGGSDLPLIPEDAADKVILVGWDGVQREHLQEMVARNEVPVLMGLAAQGALVDIDITQGRTDTKCGWAQILTGYRPDITRVHTNKRFAPIPQGLTVFERLEKYRGPDIFTGAVVAKKRHIDNEPEGTPYSLTQHNMDLFINGLHDWPVVLQEALAQLDLHAQGDFFLFVHFYEADNAGHIYGENSVEYEAAIRQMDAATGQLLDKLADLGIAEETLVYITADHGFDEGLTSHTYAPHIFLATNDPEVEGPGDRLDIGPTILDRFGIPLQILRPRLDGRAL